ncbi:ABC transporter substrate-binding protein [Patescibacteria group bacterium]|nr:ABC transporter substrate-binding protein [Patescibacteria group bacterium]
MIIGGICWAARRKAAAPVAEEGEVIKIGAILPLSGPVAMFGDWARKGMEIALEDINLEEVKIEVLFEDSKLDAKEGIIAYNKLVNIDNAGLIISAMSSVSVPLIPIVREDEKVLLLQDVTFPEITKNNPLVFRHFIQSDREALILAEYAIKTLDVNNVGILYVNDEAGVGAKNAFKRIFEQNGGSVSIMEAFGGRDTDMKTQILKIKNKGVQSIYLFGNGPSWAQALKQIRELEFTGVILTNTSMFIENFRELAGSATESVYFTYPFADEGQQSFQIFADKYKKRYGTEPQLEAFYGYDLINVIKIALDKNNWEIKNLNKAILDIKEFFGVFGKTKIDKEGDFITSIGIGIIENGALKLIEIIPN